MLNTNERIIKHKVGLLNLAEELGNVSKACQIMGLSRDTFYRYKDAVEDGGVEALLDTDRRKPNPKNRVLAHTAPSRCDFFMMFFFSPSTQDPTGQSLWISLDSEAVRALNVNNRISRCFAS